MNKDVCQMKKSILICTALLCTMMSLLSACAQSGSGGNTPALGGVAPQTGRLPSPDNYRGTAVNQGVRMNTPVAQ